MSMHPIAILAIAVAAVFSVTFCIRLCCFTPGIRPCFCFGEVRKSRLEREAARVDEEAAAMHRERMTDFEVALHQPTFQPPVTFIPKKHCDTREPRNEGTEIPLEDLSHDGVRRGVATIREIEFPQDYIPRNPEAAGRVFRADGDARGSRERVGSHAQPVWWNHTPPPPFRGDDCWDVCEVDGSSHRVRTTAEASNFTGLTTFPSVNGHGPVQESADAGFQVLRSEDDALGSGLNEVRGHHDGRGNEYWYEQMSRWSRPEEKK